jgi:hypothetical protein
MTYPANTCAVLAATLIVIFNMFSAGCGNPTGIDEKAVRHHAAATPDSKIVEQLTQTAEIGDYQLLLPMDFTPVDAHDADPAGVTSQMWHRKAPPGHQPAILVITVESDEKVVRDFSAGFAQNAGLTIHPGNELVTVEVGGITFTRAGWTGTRKVGGPVSGFFYAGVDATRLITIVGTRSNFNADDLKLLEAAIATLKRR